MGSMMLFLEGLRLCSHHVDKERSALAVWGLAGHSACRNLFLVQGRVGRQEGTGHWLDHEILTPVRL